MPEGERKALTILPITGLAEVHEGDRIADLIAERGQPPVESGDVLVVTQKIVSKAEGRVVAISEGDLIARRRAIEREAVRVLRRRDELVITETPHGFICANSGIDVSNMAAGRAALLPLDPDRSARRIREGLKARPGVDVGVIVSDTFGRPWRKGVTDVAIGCAGVAAIVDLRGTCDAMGRPLEATEVCVADEIAGAAELVMGKASSVPVAIVRGLDRDWLRPASVASEVVRPYAEDLFR